MEMTYNKDPSGFGLRRVKIRREGNGFGFTLRHFIVYPPELYNNYTDEDRKRNYLVKVTEPVDTIFVKGVVENGPADRAGLCVGDRIVSVNGRTIFGTSYDTVVLLIQKSPEILCLEVSPKQFDTLQLFFEETAYRPETNQRPYHHTPSSFGSGKTSLPDPRNYYEPHYQNSQPLYYHPNDQIYGTFSNASTESFFLKTPSHYSNSGSMSSSHPNPPSGSNPQLLSHLPRPTPYKSSSVWATPAGQPQKHHPPRVPQSGSGRSQSKSPQTYYPFNQDLQPGESFGPPHLWKIKEEPSTSGAKSAESILTGGEFSRDHYDTSHRSGSMECLNRVPTVQGQSERQSRTSQRFASYDEGCRRPESSSHRRESTGSIPNNSAMVVTMSHTNSKMQSSHPPEMSDSGSSLGGYNSGNYSPSSGQGYEHKMADRIRKSCEQKEEFLKRPNQPMSWAPLQSASANTFPKELYAQPQKFEKIPWPPANIVPTVSSTKAPPIHNCQTSSLDSANRNISVVSVQHYPSHSDYQRSNSSTGHDSAPASLSQSQDPSSYEMQVRSLSPSWLEYTPMNRTTIVGSRKLHCDPPPDWKPNYTSLIEGAGEVKLRNRKDDLDETDRLVRRVSYLKATSSPIDMDRKSATSPVPTSPTLSPTSEYRGFGSLLGVRSPDTSEVSRDGQIHYKIRLGESKQKGGYNRSWRQGWAQIRRSGCLYISKDPLSRESVALNTEDSVILAVSLRNGVTVEQAEDYSKRKHVLRVKTSYSSVDIANIAENTFTQASAHPPSHSTPVEILIQAEDTNDFVLWLQALLTQLENNNYCNGTPNTMKGIYFGPEFCPKSKSLLTSFLPSPVSNSQSQSSEKTTTTTAGSTLHPGGPNVSQTAASPKNKTWKGKVARQWKKVHNIIETGGESKGASPYTAVPSVGSTFGINLEHCPPGELNPLIPRVIEYAIDVVEKKGIDMVGLYRIPGNNASVTTLTERLNKGEDPNPERDPKWLDVHVVASLIKSFLRRLPDPLLTDDRYQAFIIAADDSEQDKCKERMQILVNDLPDTNYETLRAVIMHLKKVAEHGGSNLMDARNLAIVFGPTIVRTAEENVTSMVQDMKNQCKIVEMLISNADELFSERRFKEEDFQENSTGPSSSIPAPPISDTYSVSDALRVPTIAAVQMFNCTESSIPPPVSPSSPTIESELRASIVQAALRKASKAQSPTESDHSKHNIYGLPTKPTRKGKPIDDAGFIRSYAGLNEETEQRVKNFEMETRAMLSREDRSPHSSIINVGGRQLGGIRLMNLEDELRKAKDDLENEDYYDQLADNPNSIIHHRDRGFSMFSGVGHHNLSSSSISSSNSNGTIPSIHNPSLPAYQKPPSVGFKPSFPAQSLPPKPPLLHNSGSSGIGPASIPSKSSLSSSSSPASPLRRVSSMDRFSGDVLQVSNNAQDASKIGTFTYTPKYFGGSLDSLKDIPHSTDQDGGRNSSARKDFIGDNSSRSSDGSDLVTSISKALDSKLEKTRSTNTEPTPEPAKVSETNNKSEKAVVQNGKEIVKSEDGNKEGKRTGKFRFGGNGIKRSWRRNSMIERRVNGEICNGTTLNVKECTSANGNPSLYKTEMEATKNATNDLIKEFKPSSKYSRDCKRRHSLSGGGDILSIAYHDKSIRYFDDPDPELEANGPQMHSTDFSSGGITRAGILESHV